MKQNTNNYHLEYHLHHFDDLLLQGRENFQCFGRYTGQMAQSHDLSNKNRFYAIKFQLNMHTVSYFYQLKTQNALRVGFTC